MGSDLRVLGGGDPTEFLPRLHAPETCAKYPHKPDLRSVAFAHMIFS